MQPAETIYINYFDVIDEKRVKAIMSICSDIIANAHPKTLYFLFSSNGGSVDAGVTLYNFLMALPVEIVMHNTGSIDSIANVIFCAGSKRKASPHSAFLFHGVQMNFSQGAGLTNSQLAEVHSRLKTDEQKIQGILIERTNLTAEEINQLFVQGEAKNPAFAISKGVIHEICPPLIPKDTPLVTININ
jgi:ATP-dependent Clp protease, protease subunit